MFGYTSTKTLASCCARAASRAVMAREVAPSADRMREARVRSLEIVVELGLEGALGVGHAVVHLVDQLAVEQPREHRQGREHDDHRQRDQRGELGPDGREAKSHEGLIVAKLR